MTAAARSLLSSLPLERRKDACFPFPSPIRSQWSYFPGQRPGIALPGLSVAGRKAAHQLLATALSRPAFTQAVTIMALEEVLDLDERGQVGRRSDGYHVAVFGSPGDDGWAWRFEGHHLSVNVTVTAGRPVVGPLFLGANPAQVRDHDGRVVAAPLLREEDLARALVAGLPPALRDQAVISATTPRDIITTTAATAGPLAPPGVPASRLPGEARSQLDQLVTIYLGRLAPGLAEDEQRNIATADPTFAWAGGLRAGQGHYYRIQAPGLLVEFHNAQRSANHAHTVLRRPGRRLRRVAAARPPRRGGVTPRRGN
jgi:Protein of unknown function (DUF3500)